MPASRAAGGTWLHHLGGQRSASQAGRRCPPSLCSFFPCYPGLVLPRFSFLVGNPALPARPQIFSLLLWASPGRSAAWASRLSLSHSTLAHLPRPFAILPRLPFPFQTPAARLTNSNHRHQRICLLLASPSAKRSRASFPVHGGGGARIMRPTAPHSPLSPDG